MDFSYIAQECPQGQWIVKQKNLKLTGIWANYFQKFLKTCEIQKVLNYNDGLTTTILLLSESICEFSKRIEINKSMNIIANTFWFKVKAQLRKKKGMTFLPASLNTKAKS